MGLLLSIGACQTSQPPIRQYALLSALEHNLASAKGASDNALKELKADVKKQGDLQIRSTKNKKEKRKEIVQRQVLI